MRKGSTESPATAVSRGLAIVLGCVWLLAVDHGTAHAVDVTGTVHLTGQVQLSAPIPGINADDLTVSVKTATEATGNGEKCTILSTTSDSPDGTGAYPDFGDVSAQILLERGGPSLPDGSCIITVRADGTDGVSVSARGTQTIFVNATQIGTNATVTVPIITARQSKAVAGVDRDCLKWVKKQMLKRTRCNFLLLKKGPAAAGQCTDAGIEPASCDPGNHVEAILAFAHDSNDQQTNPLAAQGVDFEALKNQVKCQKRFGKAASLFSAKRLKKIQIECVEANLDSTNCRDNWSRDAKTKLQQIEKCEDNQTADSGTGRIVPDVAPPCDACIDGSGVLDDRCLKACFQLVLDEVTDGLMGDIPVCGNGILQGGEFCDDGNLINGDCCSSTCTVEPPPGTEGPLGDPTCADTIDNDCDGLTDATDPGCQ